MFNQLPRVWWLIAAITALSVILVHLGGKGMLETTKGTRVGLGIGYLLGGVLFGMLALQAYLWVAQLWPAAPSTTYFWIAIALTAVLTFAAIGMFWVVKDMRVVAIWITLNLLWGLGYGLLIPRLVDIGGVL